MGSQDRFGYEWDKYDFMLPMYEKQFLMWIGPDMGPEDFKDKSVLDGGCGMGRNSYWPCKYGAKEVVAFDFDKRSIEAAKKTLKDYPQAKVVYKSIYDIDFINRFDIAFSIGVIHHLEDPKKAVQNLFRAVKPGGKMILWVYGYENNEWVVRYINPIRKITSRLPVALTHFIAYFFSIPLWLYIHIIPQRSEYLKLIRKFRFDHMHSIVFDQLIPKIANYWKKEEVEDLVNSLPGNKKYKLYHTRNYSWTVVVEKE